MSLRDAQNMVRAFHVKFGVPAPSSPVGIDDDVVGAHEKRLGWISDEIEEGWRAFDMANADVECIAELADAYIDIIVFALGGLVELGVDGTPLFDAVMRSNMTKVKVPGVAKIQKPEGFVHPDIGALIDEQRRGK